MSGKKIVVLGGGFGGVRAAITARSLLDANHEVVLIDRNRVTYLCGANPFLIVGERAIDKTSRSLGRLANRGIRFVEDDIQQIDTSDRVVHTSSGEFPFDYLVVALGAAYDWNAVPRSSQAHSFYSFETAIRLRRRLNRLRRGRIIIAAAAPPYKCPPAPFEVAMVIDSAFKKKGIRRDTEIHVFIPEPTPVAVAGSAASQRVRSDLARKGIELHVAAGVREVAGGGRSASFADGSSIDADVIATIPVHRLPAVVGESGLAGGKPWVPVDRHTLETGESDIFAVGDVNTIPIGEDRAVPKAGVFASGQGEVVGQLIASRINGSEQPPPYDGVGKCFMAYSGSQSAMLGGTFLAEGGPKVGLEPPTAAGMRRKERFELDWRRFRI